MSVGYIDLVSLSSSVSFVRYRRTVLCMCTRLKISLHPDFDTEMGGPGLPSDPVLIYEED